MRETLGRSERIHATTVIEAQQDTPMEAKDRNRENNLKYYYFVI